MGLFSRGGSGGGKPNPMGAKLAGVVPQVPEVVPDVAPEAVPQVVPQATAAPGLSPATPRSPNTTSLAAAAPAVPAGATGPVLFSVQAGYNLPTPDPFAKNRQKVGRSFGEAVVGDGVLLLRLRRRRVGVFIPPLEVRADEVERAAPTETDFMGNNRGVALVRRDGEHLYVWVDDPVALLGTLSGQGFTVDDVPVAVTRAG